MISDFTRLLNAIGNIILGGPRPKKPLPEVLFYPVIFANGRDDDTEGVKAFYENRPVILKGEVIRPGPRTISNMELSLSVSAIWFSDHGRMFHMQGFIAPGFPIVQVEVGHGVQRTIAHCTVGFGLKVQA